MKNKNSYQLHWHICKVRDALDFIGGGTPSKRVKHYWKGNIPWASVKDIKGMYLISTQESISQEGLNNSSSKLAQQDNLIVATRINPGKPIITKLSAAINQDLKIVIPKIKFASKFLFYSFIVLKKEIVRLSSGTTVLGISLKSLNELSLAYPPLPEQRAIVAKIEQLFSELENGIANLKKALEQLKTYRQAVLNSTVADCTQQSISSVVDNLTQGWSPKCKRESSRDPNEWAVIKTSAIQAGSFIQDENKVLPDNLIPREQHEIQIDDILITRAGPRVRVGVCCLVKKTRPRLLNCDKVYRLRVNDKIILPTYFEYLMNSPTYTHKIEEIKTGGNDSGLNLTQSRYLNLKIPIPDIDQQKLIVQEIETRLSICDKLEEDIKENLEKSEALRQSILKQAFEGKLLSQAELDACRLEPDWEPAEKLLERIKS